MKKNMLLGLFLLVVMADFAFGGLAFESGVESVRDSLSGPIATAIGVVAIVAGGLMWSFQGDGGATTGLKGLIGLAFVIGIALTANSTVSTFSSGQSGGAVITTNSKG